MIQDSIYNEEVRRREAAEWERDGLREVVASWQHIANEHEALVGQHEQTIARLRAIADEALEQIEDAEGYIGDHFWQKHYADDVARLRAALAVPTFSPFNPEGVTMDESGNLTYLDGAAPPEPEPHRKSRRVDICLHCGHEWPCVGSVKGILGPASSTPTEVERLRAENAVLREGISQLPPEWQAVVGIGAALSGQQDTTEAHDPAALPADALTCDNCGKTMGGHDHLARCFPGRSTEERGSVMSETPRELEVQRDSDGMHLYEVTLNLAVPYQLPDGVWESAVLRAVRDPKAATSVGVVRVRKVAP